MSPRPPAALVGLPLAIAIFGGLASAQSPADVRERVLYFQPTTTAQESQSIVNAIRTITDIPQPSNDEARKSATFRGTPAQVDMAEWLFQRLDRPAGGAPLPGSVSPEYLVPGAADDLVRVFYPAHLATSEGLIGLVNTLRTLADIQRLFACLGVQAVAMRGTAGQAALTEWLVNALDKPDGWHPPASQNTVAYDYWNRPTPDANASAVRVFYTAHTETPQGLNEVVNLTRILADLQRLFPFGPAKALVLRGTPNQAALAEFLLNALDKPADWQPAAGQNPAESQYRADDPRSKGEIDLVRVFYVTPTVTPQDLQALVTQIRIAANIQKIFANPTHHALALRGTATQVSIAEQLVAPRYQPLPKP